MSLKAHNTFTNFYLKDLTWSDNDNNMYLGPVVAAQQVVDPSPQTAHPRKEKGGGAHPLQPSLQASNPRVKVLVTSSGCYGKVYYLLFN